MKPSFFCLFRRGRYFHQPPPINLQNGKPTPEQKRKMRESERYAVAAIAFCMKHSPRFREKFWNAICKAKGDPPLERNCQIEIEPAMCADLWICNSTSQGRFVYVVECKVEAGLEAHQDPSTCDFWDDIKKGYGAQLFALEPSSQRRFCILGFRRKLNLQKRNLRSIEITQKGWSDMERCWPTPKTINWEDTLVLDLFDSLGDLNIQNFRHRGSNNMKVNNSLVEAARAFRILRDTAEKLGLLERHWQLDCSEGEGVSNWHFGIGISKLPPKHGKSENQRLLSMIVMPAAESVAWFGYISEKPAMQKLGVWFYCGKKSAATKVLTELKKAGFQEAIMEPDKDEDGRDWFNVVVRTTTHKFGGDRDWFLSVFQHAGLKVAH